MVSTLFARARVPRIVWHTIGLILATLLAYLIWRGYQSPDFLLDFSAFRICEADTQQDLQGATERSRALEADTWHPTWHSRYNEAEVRAR